MSQCGDETFNLLPSPTDAGASAAGGGGGYPDGFPPPCGFGTCPDAAFECPPGTQFCKMCSDARDCSSVDSPFCSQKFHFCVQCVDDSTCGVGYACNDLTGRCGRACIYSSDCSTTQTALCDNAVGVCVECIEDSHCRAQPTKPFCRTGECVECYDNVGCAQTEVCVNFHCQHR